MWHMHAAYTHLPLCGTLNDRDGLYAYIKYRYTMEISYNIRMARSLECHS